MLGLGVPLTAGLELLVGGTPQVLTVHGGSGKVVNGFNGVPRAMT